MTIMSFRIFYKFTIALVSLYIISTGISFVYALYNLSVVDKFLTGLIFFIGTFVGLYIVKYYSRGIIFFEFDSENIILKSIKGFVSKKKDDCSKIINKGNELVLEFSDNSKYYIIKSYFFNKKIADFSVFNEENFKNALIVK